MTTTSNPPAADADELTYTLAHTLVRPYVTGEQPIYKPAVPVLRPVGIDELNRLATTTTMVLETDIPPHVARPATSTVYAPVSHRRRPRFYRGLRRAEVPLWAAVLALASLALSGGAVGGGAVLALAVLKAGGSW